MKIIEKFVDITTGEEIISERDETKEEIAERKNFEEERAIKVQLQQEKEIAKEAVKAKLTTLGLTSDDLIALGL